MPYTKDRLYEALEIIRDDTRRIHALQAEKLARTQYREGFHLRRSTNLLANPIHVCRNDDTSDDEYNPDMKRKKRRLQRDNDHEEEAVKARKGNGKRKRKIVPNTMLESDQDDNIDKPSKRPKTGDEGDIAEDAPRSAFLTLRFKSDTGRALLAEKLIKREEVIVDNRCEDILNQNNGGQSQWEAASGGLHRANRSISAQSQDHELAKQINAIEELDTYPRKLRSGRIRENLIPKKRRMVDSENESEAETYQKLNTVQQTKRKKVEIVQQDHQIEDQLSHLETSIKSLDTQYRNQSTGNTPDDAISIASSSDGDSSRTMLSSPQEYPVCRKSSSHTTPPSSLATNPSLASTSTSISPTAHNENNEEGTLRISTQKTHFSHPINFKCPDTTKCSFHNDYRHPILGHGLAIGQYMISPHTPSQWIELESGHRSKDIPADTMCITCALAYIQIIRCERHTFSRVKMTPRHVAALNNQARVYVKDMFTEKRAHDPTRNNRALVETCSMCPAPAAWRCTEPQLEDKMRRPCRLPDETVEAAHARVERHLLARDPATPPPPPPPSHAMDLDIHVQPPIRGCGLVLCSQCCELVRDRHAGRLQQNRPAILAHVNKQRLPARADFDFLFRDGLVWMAYNVDR